MMYLSVGFLLLFLASALVVQGQQADDKRRLETFRKVLSSHALLKVEPSDVDIKLEAVTTFVLDNVDADITWLNRSLVRTIESKTSALTSSIAELKNAIDKLQKVNPRVPDTCSTKPAVPATVKMPDSARQDATGPFWYGNEGLEIIWDVPIGEGLGEENGDS